MSARPLKETIVGIKTLADLMLESNPDLRPDTLGVYRQHLVTAEDFEALINGACGGEYPHGLMFIMQGRLNLETDEAEFLEE